MRFADSIDAIAVSLTPTWRVSHGRTSFDATATASHLDGAWSNSALLDGSWTTRTHRRVSGEIEGVAGGSAHSDGARTGQFMAFGRAHVSGQSRGAWLGAGLGAAWDVAWRDVVQADAGAWLSTSGADHVGRLRPTIVDDSIRYTDFELVSHLAFGRWQLDASFGARAGDPIPTLPANHRAWGSASAELQLTPRVGLVVSAGSYPVDFTQGYPGGRYLSFAVRFRAPGSGEIPARAQSDAVVRDFRPEIVSPGRYRLRVLAPAATLVELAGDFTQWRPVRLEPERGGWWFTILTIAPGTHEAAVRVDGGTWRAPPGLTGITDEFGGQSGVLIVPP